MSLTAANATIFLTVGTVFPVPVQLQQFSTDDVFSIDSLSSAEVQMGVDGKLSGGFVYREVMQHFTLQANSPSNAIFDAWYAAQQAAQDVISATGLTRLKSVNTSYVLTNGFLTAYKPAPDAKKVLQARQYTITWESISAAPIT